MKGNTRLLFGPLAGIILGFGIAGLALMVPEYSQVQQTVSEIGEAGSPARIPFAVMLCCVAVCILVFAAGIRHLSVEIGHSPLVAYFIACMALSVAGVGIFAYPHPLHNVFGVSETIGYQAPAVLALTWRRDARTRTLVAISWAMLLLIWIAIGLNMSAMDRHSQLWAYLKPNFGVVQRALFAAWFGWCALIGVLSFHRQWRSNVVDTSRQLIKTAGTH